MFKSLDDIRSAFLDYLLKEKELYETDIQKHKSLTIEEKEELGFYIREAYVIENIGDDYVLRVPYNNTKLRAGDSITLIAGSRAVGSAKVIEVGFDTLSIEFHKKLSMNDVYSISVDEFVLLDPIIELLGRIKDGAPGEFFLKELAGLEQPQLEDDFFAIQCKTFPSRLNELQRKACESVLKMPSLYCIQGPPGTGKTDVLSTIAQAYSEEGYEVLVISNTHQAVNNALNKIAQRATKSRVIKVGEELKGEELIQEIIKAETYKEYILERKSIPVKSRSCGDIVGMTYHASVLNLGLKKSGFKPMIVLVDEAGQMPVSQASVLGAYGSGCVVFIGDDAQMPPVFHPELSNDPLSVSIFTYLKNLYPQVKTCLEVTYRMNSDITQVVSRNFYEPDGIVLTSSDFSKDRKLCLHSVDEDEAIRSILSSDDSIILQDVTSDNLCEDCNVEEADFATRLASAAMKSGLQASDVAIITPYRRQVRTARAFRKEMGCKEEPLIDTVERLQGQDVDLIIISFSVSSKSYFNANRDFLINNNRLNVMISRAKKKVVILCTPLVKDELKSFM